MLKGISPLISPELLYTLAAMGHGDCIVFADANFPAEGVGKDTRVIRADGLPITALLPEILRLFPVDDSAEAARVMAVSAADHAAGVTTPVWGQYKAILGEAGFARPMHEVERFRFYDEARKAFAIVQTGERALYANLALVKGVVTGD